MVERHHISEEEYRALPMPSYSLLKKLDDHGPRSIGKKYVYESEAIDFGSLLDCRLFTPEIFKDKFYFESVNKPTGQVLDLANYIHNQAKELGLTLQDINTDTVLATADELKLFDNVKDVNKRINKFDNELFWNYLSAKQDSHGKTVFTPDIEEECAKAEQIIRTHTKTSFLFEDAEEVETINQMMIVATIHGVDVKGMLDMVRINHKDKTITPYDLKATEYRQVNFPIQFKRMKYYLQGALYSLLLRAFYADLIISGYVVKNFCFLVYSRSDRYPFIWEMSDTWMDKAIYGYVDNDGDHDGIIDLLHDYKFYVENNFFEVDRIIAENSKLTL
jgi:hypothetical protein